MALSGFKGGENEEQKVTHIFGTQITFLYMRAITILNKLETLKDPIHNKYNMAMFFQDWSYYPLLGSQT